MRSTGDTQERRVADEAHLLHQAELLALLLVEAHSHSVLLLEALQGQDEQLGVMLVRQRRKLDGAELARLQPVHRCGVDRHRLLRSHIRTVLRAHAHIIQAPIAIKFR